MEDVISVRRLEHALGKYDFGEGCPQDLHDDRAAALVGAYAINSADAEFREAVGLHLIEEVRLVAPGSMRAGIGLRAARGAVNCASAQLDDGTACVMPIPSSVGD